MRATGRMIISNANSFILPAHDILTSNFGFTVWLARCRKYPKAPAFLPRGIFFFVGFSCMNNRIYINVDSLEGLASGQIKHLKKQLNP